MFAAPARRAMCSLKEVRGSKEKGKPGTLGGKTSLGVEQSPLRGLEIPRSMSLYKGGGGKAKEPWGEKEKNADEHPLPAEQGEWKAKKLGEEK